MAFAVDAFIESQVAAIRQQVGAGQVLCALSGGVDSAVAAALVHKAVGDQLVCLFVDHGLLRKGEAQQVVDTFAGQFQMRLIAVDASERFFGKLAGVVDPEEKRKLIGNEFIYVFEEEAAKLGEVGYLVQGTVAADVIESGAGAGEVIKSHHNVGGLPPGMKFELVEPLRTLYKEEVRAVGRRLGLPEAIVGRHPFPGPGLAVRVLGEVTREKVAMLQEADAIYLDEIRKAGLYDEIWQAFAVLPDVRSVGVTDGRRTYSRPVILRAVTSTDGMSASCYPLPFEVLQRVMRRIIAEVPGVNRVAFDVTDKPPGTIEWE